MKKKNEPPEVHTSVSYTGAGKETHYWAHLFRGMEIEKKAGPFLTAQEAADAFLPVKVWPKLSKPPRG